MTGTQRESHKTTLCSVLFYYHFLPLNFHLLWVGRECWRVLIARLGLLLLSDDFNIGFRSFYYRHLLTNADGYWRIIKNCVNLRFSGKVLRAWGKYFKRQLTSEDFLISFFNFILQSSVSSMEIPVVSYQKVHNSKRFAHNVCWHCWLNLRSVWIMLLSFIHYDACSCPK